MCIRDRAKRIEIELGVLAQLDRAPLGQLDEHACVGTGYDAITVLQRFPWLKRLPDTVMLDPGGHLHAINNGKGTICHWNGLRQSAAKQQTGSEQIARQAIFHGTFFRKSDERDSNRLPDLRVFGQNLCSGSDFFSIDQRETLT